MGLICIVDYHQVSEMSDSEVSQALETTCIGNTDRMEISGYRA